jgi:hypothetical protein
MSLPHFSNNRRPVSAALVAGGAIVFSLVASAPARADVKIVTKQTMSGTGPQMAMMGNQGPKTVTTYYKGGKTRVETGDTIVITDGASGTIYTLNATRKTYMVTKLSDAGNAAGMMGMMDFKSTGAVKPGGKTRVIAGKPAKNYLWTAKVTVSPKPGANPGGAGAGMKPGAAFMTMNMKGETWTTEAVKLPGALPANLRMMGGMAQATGLKDLTQTLSKMKGLPLEGVTTQEMQMNMGGMGGAPGQKTGAQPMSMTVKTQTVSLSEAPLPASLFAVPAGYTKVTAPAPGQRPMGAPGAPRAPRVN